jgi:flagellar biosynthesis protein FlhB
MGNGEQEDTEKKTRRSGDTERGDAATRRRREQSLAFGSRLNSPCVNLAFFFLLFFLFFLFFSSVSVSPLPASPRLLLRVFFPVPPRALLG